MYNVYTMYVQCIYNVYKILKQYRSSITLPTRLRQCLYKLIQISQRQHLNNVKKVLQILSNNKV